MKHKLPLILAAMCFGASAQAATLDLAGLTGTIATGYTDSSGITVSYALGSSTNPSETSGFSGDTGGMSLSVGQFPDGHLAVGPGDTVTLNFGAVRPTTVSITFFDLDRDPSNQIGTDESVTILSAGAPANVAGDNGFIPNASADTTGVITIPDLVPNAAGEIVLQAAAAPANSSGYFAISAETQGDGTGPEPVIPEPSSSLLALLGLSLVAFRRRR